MRAKLSGGSKAFTLIELLVVVAIVSLLSSIVLAALNTAREKGRLAAARSFAAQVQHTLGDRALDYWSFDECSGTTVGDTGSTNAPGTFVGSPAWSSDTQSGRGCSISFNGSSKITVPAASVPTGATGAYTKAAWVKISTLSVGNILSGGGSVGGSAFYVPNGKLCGGHNGDWNSRCDSQSIADSQWHFVALSYNPSLDGGSLRLYRDGLLVYSASSIPPISNGAVEIASFTPANYMNGLIDEVALYDGALF